MSISEVLLFIATNSRACVECMKFIENYHFPAKIVRLDSEEARSIAANGKYFQVTVVPTMVVIYDDGNTQLFIGLPKITQWMTMILKKSQISEQREKERGVTSYMPAGGNMYGPRPNPPRPRYSQERGMMPDDPIDRRYHEDEGEYQLLEELEDEQEIPQESQRRPPQKRVVVEEDEPEELPPKKKKGKQTPKQKKKKKPPVQFEEPEQEIEVEYIDEPPQPPAPMQKAQKPLKTAPSRMNSIYNVAKQMEKDRTTSLGYREEDLPRYQ